MIFNKQAIKAPIERINSDFLNLLLVVLSILVKIAINDKFGKTVSNAELNPAFTDIKLLSLRLYNSSSQENILSLVVFFHK